MIKIYELKKWNICDLCKIMKNKHFNSILKGENEYLMDEPGTKINHTMLIKTKQSKILRNKYRCSARDFSEDERRQYWDRTYVLGVQWPRQGGSSPNLRVEQPPYYMATILFWESSSALPLDNLPRQHHDVVDAMRKYPRTGVPATKFLCN